MDPNAALREFWEAFEKASKAANGPSSDSEIEALWEAVLAAESLFVWLKSFGFQPDWTAQP